MLGEINCNNHVLRYNIIMTTLSELHTYWHQQLDALHAQNDTPIRNWQLVAWLSFQLPLALNTSVPFYKDVGPYWCDTVHTIMRSRLDNILKAKITEYGIDDGYWNIETTALIALNEAGAKVVSPPSHMEKNLTKIEAYKQQKTVLGQFLHSFYHSQTAIYDRVKILQLTYDDVKIFLTNVKRNQTIEKKAQDLLAIGGFGSVGVQHGICNTKLIDAMGHLLSSLMLVQKENLPTTVAGLDGCNICFNKTDNILGSFGAQNNSIHINVNNQMHAVFWHEWMHMLEARVGHINSLQNCPTQWEKYRTLNPHVNEINKMVRTIPQDASGAGLYFNSGFNDPFFSLINCVETLCNNAWFHPNACDALRNELNQGAPHSKYNLEAFKHILRTHSSVEQRNADITTLFNQWRNDGTTELSHETVNCAQSYDSNKKQLLNFCNELKHKKSNFLSAAKVLDHSRSSLYWSAQNELLARSFESFVQDRWQDPALPFFDEKVPQGQEREYVIKGFTTFMQAFKMAWNNQPVQDVVPLRSTQISDKRGAPATAKKRLTRF